MAYDPQDVETLMRMVRRRVRAFGWEVEEAVPMISDAVERAEKKDMAFSEIQCVILEVLEESYEAWEAGELEEEYGEGASQHAAR